MYSFERGSVQHRLILAIWIQLEASTADRARLLNHTLLMAVAMFGHPVLMSGDTGLISVTQRRRNPKPLLL